MKHHPSKTIFLVFFLFQLLQTSHLLYSQIAATSDSLLPSITKTEKPNEQNFKMTTLTFGGNGAYFTSVNKTFTVLTGGRGSATFNERYTIGGGGWGMPKGVEVESSEPGTYDFVKMGYGGIEVGYILYPGKKINFGTNLLIAGGAVFKETVPETKNNGFKMFPVLEPSLYCQLKMSNLFRFEMGATYRYVTGTNLPYISNRNLSGFSCYVGFLVSACSCK